MMRMVGRLGVASAALLAAAFAETVAPVYSADAFLSGTYREISPATRRVMSVGNEVVFLRDRRGRIAFSLNAIRPSDSNMGYIGGTFARNSARIVWTSDKEYARCKLTFVSLPHAMLQITQDVRFGDCGFGYGVLSDGLYKRTQATGKLGSWNGP